MRKNDPHFMTLQTVRTFLQRLSSETRVGIVSFDEKARLLEPLASISDANANQRLMQSLDQIDFKGKFTNSASGIERALYELKTSVHPKSQRCIIFLTDGIIDTGNEQKDAQLTQWLKNDLTVECREEGIRIFGIAFTENADFTLDPGPFTKNRRRLLSCFHPRRYCRRAGPDPIQAGAATCPPGLVRTRSNPA